MVLSLGSMLGHITWPMMGQEQSVYVHTSCALCEAKTRFEDLSLSLVKHAPVACSLRDDGLVCPLHA